MGEELRKYAIENNMKQQLLRLEETACYDIQDQLTYGTEYVLESADYAVTVNNSVIENSLYEPPTSIRSKFADYRWRIQNECCSIL